jgi:two-component system sensor histidine kinase YesM
MVLLPENVQNESRVVYFTGMEEEKQQIADAYYNGDDSVYLCSSYANSMTKWSILNVITKQELEKDSNNIRQIILLVILIMIVISINMAAIISSYITKPLDKLAKTMSGVEVGNLKVETEFDNSEVGRIGNRFKSLVNNNLELRDRLLNLEIKEKDAQLLLLQSQINPHFLYNTLDALYFMALIEQADDIADMVQALSDMFKLSLNKGDKLIALRDEIERMKDYMKILNIRFQNRFTLYVNVKDDILETKMLTFLLQPILENAIYHGLESQIGPGNIYLEARRENDCLYLSIRDDGVGIDDMSLLEKGYGIRNIKERIRLFYGEEYPVNIVSERNVGTTVSIVIPLWKEEESCTV